MNFSAEEMHRLLKADLDSGKASSVEEALARFRQYGVKVVLGASVSRSVSSQIIALTAINTASRALMGNVVIVSAQGDFPLLVPGFSGQSLFEFCAWLGMSGSIAPGDWPTIAIGSDVGPESEHRVIRPWASGWVFGLGEGVNDDRSVFAPAAVAAGALAVSEAFSVLRGDNAYAGRRGFTWSLWTMKADHAQPKTFKLVGPGDTWLVGLGHLGQAYAWTLGMMFGDASPHVVLQDTDEVSVSTLSTSVLTVVTDKCRRKVDVVGDWLKTRGASITKVLAPFNSATKVGARDPHVALFGVDNAAARRGCENSGFSLILDAGLGSGHQDFRGIRIRSFPGPASASALWAADATPSDASNAPAYRRMLREGANSCGVTTLATRAVGAPFVGCYASAFLVAELVRRNADFQKIAVIDMNMKYPERTDVALLERFSRYGE